MRVVLLVGDQANQWALVHKLAEVVEVQAVVLSGNVPRRRPRGQWRILVNRIGGRLVGRPLRRAWSGMLERYAREYPRDLQVETRRVANVNETETLETLRSHSPDLVAVSGTNLVGKAVIDAARTSRGIVNLHTGVSPYVKGGPNCTNWCLATGRFDLIGNSVMWLDSGIDSGALLATERTPLSGKETLTELHWKVMEHAHDLYCRSLSAIRDGLPVSRVAQAQIAEGRTFFNAQWSPWVQAMACLNFRLRYSSKAVEAHDPTVRLVPLPARGSSL